MIVAQLYGLTGDRLTAMADIHRSGDLHVVINGTGWYGHRTTFIEVWRTDPTEDRVSTLRP